MTYRADDATRYAPAVDVAGWIEAYRQAWETADADLVLTLFTEDASYRANPFEEPHHGHAGIRAYWESVTSQQREPSVRMGRPFVNGRSRGRRVVDHHGLRRPGGDAPRMPPPPVRA